MPERRCPVCGQTLPEALTQNQIDSRVQSLAVPVISEERKRLKGEFAAREAALRENARKQAERDFVRKISEADARSEKKELENVRLKRQIAQKIRLAAEKAKRDGEIEAERKAERRQKQTEQRQRKEITRAVRLATHKRDVELEKVQRDRERDRGRYEADSARMQGQLDHMSRKLEKQSGERLGEEGELDLEAALIRAFPKDRVERIGRGTRGADIVQHVMDGTAVAGRIVYENKNVSGWSNAYITQAGKYRTQYETPYVMIVSRTFPRKQKDFCLSGGIPVVRPRMAAALSAIMRDGIIAIARMRLSAAGRDQKAQELLLYLVSDKFETRFGAIANGVDGLRQQQKTERDWHERSWETQSSLHDRIDKYHREIKAQLDTILTSKRPVVMAARA